MTGLNWVFRRSKDTAADYFLASGAYLRYRG